MATTQGIGDNYGMGTGFRSLLYGFLLYYNLKLASRVFSLRTPASSHHQILHSIEMRSVLGQGGKGTGGSEHPVFCKSLFQFPSFLHYLTFT